MASNPQEAIAPTVSAEDLTALQRAVANFDREQLIWSSGYLAGMAGSTAPNAFLDDIRLATAANAAISTQLSLPCRPDSHCSISVARGRNAQPPVAVRSDLPH